MLDVLRGDERCRLMFVSVSRVLLETRAVVSGVV